MKKQLNMERYLRGILLSAIFSVLLLGACKSAELLPVKSEEKLSENSIIKEENISKISATNKAAEAKKPVKEREEKRKKKPEPEKLRFIDAWGEWHDTVIDENVPKHDYDWKYLTNNKKGIAYEGDERYIIEKGVDVSHHQGKIDWKKVKKAGYDFAIIRLGYRGYGKTGNLCDDKTFKENIKGAESAGLDVGVYIFSQAINKKEAKEEANFVLERIKGIKLDLPVVYDPELIRDDDARTDNVSGEQFTENTIIFCEMIKKAGYTPMIYSNMVWEAELFDMERLKDYKFWYADYEKIPQTPYTFEYWQHSSEGRVPGIKGNADLNIRFIKK